jgi:predicted metal-dependent HD superfamily phosphohydrolase
MIQIQMPMPKREATAPSPTIQDLPGEVGFPPATGATGDRDRIRALEKHVERVFLARLPPHLLYHGPHHTLADVFPAVDRLCDGEAVSPGDRDLVLAAALFHDIGFLETYDGNEPVGARIAAETLPGFGFQPPDVSRVRALILGTAMKEVDGAWRQVPGSDPLARILCDADLDNLGREDFFAVSASLRRELSSQGRDFTELQWLARQILFVSQQEWFTRTQYDARQAGKEANLAELRRQLAGLL